MLLKLLDKFISATIILASVRNAEASDNRHAKINELIEEITPVEETFVREDERLFEDGREIVS